MLGLLLSMMALGLAAIDPLGIALMLLLLVQKRPFYRSVIFLLGSACALVCVGYLFARGLGVFILRTEDAHHWLGPSFQLVTGALLIIFAIYTHIAHASQEPSKQVVRYINAKDLVLFLYGFMLVTLQSIIDVVFIVAMTHVARLHLSSARLLVALMTYALAALCIQIVIVLAYALTPEKNRQQIIAKSNAMLSRYAQHVTVGLGLLLGIILCLNGLLMTLGKPHL